MSIDLLLNGVLFGLFLSIFIGPVFFVLIQTAIQKGFVGGLYMAIGILISDSVCVSVIYMGISYVSSNESFLMYVGLIGGSILLISGISNFFKPVVKNEKGGNSSNLNKILRGFILNGINPFVLTFWLGIVSMVTVNFNYDKQQAFLFFVFMLSTVFLIDMVKCYLAGRLSRFFTYKVLKKMNIVVGIFLVIFGFRLLYFAYTSKFSPLF